MDRLCLAAFLAAAQKAARGRAHPDIALRVFQQAAEHGGIAAEVLLRLAGVRVHRHQGVVHGGRHQVAGLIRLQFGDEGPALGHRQLHIIHLAGLAVEGHQRGAASAYPDLALVVFSDRDRDEMEEGVLADEAPAVPAAAHRPVLVREQQPQIPCRIAEDLACAYVAYVFVFDQVRDLHALQRTAFVNEKSVAVGCYPEAPLAVQAKRSDRFVAEGVRKEFIAVELFFITERHAEAFRGRSEPEVLAAVAEDGVNFSGRDFVGETGSVLETDAFGSAVVFKHSLADDAQQDRILVHGVDEVHVAVHHGRAIADCARERFAGHSGLVHYAEATHSGEPDFVATGVADMVGLVSQRRRAQQGKIVQGIAVHGPAAGGKHPQRVAVAHGRG